MPRGPRIIIEGMPHHILHRGNNRQQIFYDKRDYSFLMKNFQEVKKEFHCLIYGYCFMPNHIHVVIQPEKKKTYQKC